jgi:hypothetical protein
MQVAISGRLKTELQNISIGRMPKRDGNVANYVKMIIGSGGISTSYYTGETASTPIGTDQFFPPYFDGVKEYDIKSVTWTGGSMTASGYIGT